MKTITAIGIMSGTSLDGLDIACSRFSGSQQNPDWEILYSETVRYTDNWQSRLAKAQHLSGIELAKLDVEYGHYIGSLAKSFITRHNLNPEFIASHGHTIFHQPGHGYTLQVGHGGAIAAETQLKVVCDFRSLDVALGGQGAPLVPIGDRLLFKDYSACLNLGGFSNISYENKGERMAYDICPVNITLNYFAQKLGFDFDEDGQIATSGILNTKLLKKLNSIDYFNQPPPKSLGREWVEKNIIPIIDGFEIETTDILRTLTEHVAFQIHSATRSIAPGTMLLTGGGAENTFLVSRIKAHTNHEIIIPEKKLIHFKEALIFALLGYLRLENRVNTLASVTGANRDSSGGCIYQF